MATHQIIKSEGEYEKALARLEMLGDLERLSSAQEDELELLSMLVEKYEEETCPIDWPDPVEAIKFRMEQENLSRKDLAAYIGSESKVSEVLNRKIPLSLAMMRSLHEGLGIPAEVLLRDSCILPSLSVSQFPFAEMFKRGYFAFSGTLQAAKRQAADLLAGFFGDYELNAELLYCRKGDSACDENALKAWHCRVRNRIRQRAFCGRYDQRQVTDELCRRIAQLSYCKNGLFTAVEMLGKIGITVLFERHLPKTYLDGAAFIVDGKRPVIGLTLRYNRLDNIWFTLMHELGHIRLHVQGGNDCFLDNTYERGDDACRTKRELEADSFARDLLIPSDVWLQEGKRLCKTNSWSEVCDFCSAHLLSPSIVVGRIHRETGNYAKFANRIEVLSERHDGSSMGR